YNYWKKISPYENSTWGIVHFWKIFLTFNFITFTRIWFRLDQDGAPMEMLQQIQQNFNFSWDALGLLIWTFNSVFIILVVGYFIHWMPQRFKDKYEMWFTKMPMPFQIIS